MSLPSGVITIWSGSIGTIPAGYVICDGNNGTPNLRDKFVVGAGSTYAVGTSGGALTHFHNLTTPPIIGEIDDAGGAGEWDAYTDSKSNLPPYYALAYIMKT